MNNPGRPGRLHLAGVEPVPPTAQQTDRPAWVLLLPEEAATFLKVTRTLVMDLARRGALPCVHVGRFIRFRQEDLEAWAAKGGAHSGEGVRNGYLQAR
jgi:excisionase family DNA binding protein